MIKRLILGIIIVAILVVILAVNQVEPTSAQQLTPTPSQAPLAPTNMPIAENSDLEYRVVKLEAEQSNTIEALKETNQRNTSIITFISALLGIVIAIQTIVTLFQKGRDAKRDGEELIGVRKINEIMDVVRNSEDIRLKQAEKDQKKTEEAQKESEDLKKQIAEFNVFMQGQKTIRATRWKSITDRASEWSKARTRKDFGSIASELRKFADEFDQFEAYFRTGNDDDSVFDPNAHYIRGVAAHYVNDPETVLKQLDKVVERNQPEKDENEVSFKKRKANAYYYLGLTESNFGNFERSIEYFTQGREFELSEYDALTQIVIAEAYVFARAYENADSFLKDAIAKFDDMEQEKGQLEPHQLRRRSRAVLIKANIHIIQRLPDWQKRVQELLLPVHEKDPLFFYAITTLAQSYYLQNDMEKASELFNEADERIQEAVNSPQSPEVRSRILFWMTAAMAAMTANPTSNKNRANGHLGNASSLIDVLPKINNQACTVYSPLSKKNEQVEEVKKHIDYIRKGMVLLNHNKNM